MGEAGWSWQKVSGPAWCLFARCLALGRIQVHLSLRAAGQGHGERSPPEQPWELRASQEVNECAPELL